jgi:hypothetical protein
MQVLRSQVGQARPADLVLLLHALSCHGMHPPATTWEAALAALEPALQHPPPLAPSELAAARQLEEQYRQAEACCLRLEERLAQLEALKGLPPVKRATAPPASVCVAGGELVPAHRLRRARQCAARQLRKAAMKRQQLHRELAERLAPLATWQPVQEEQQQQQQQQQPPEHYDSSGLLFTMLLTVPGAPVFGLEAFTQGQRQSSKEQATPAHSMGAPLDHLQSRLALAAAALRPRHVALLLLALGKAQHVPRSTSLQVSCIMGHRWRAYPVCKHIPCCAGSTAWWMLLLSAGLA